MFENLPLPQAAHSRLDIAVADAVWNSPGAHTLCCKQELTPEPGWNLSDAHAVHVGALMVFEYVPAAHFWHWRSLLCVPGPVSYSPSRHTAFSEQELWPGLL